MKIPQTRPTVENQVGRCLHRKVNWAQFADKSQPKVDLVFAFPQERNVVPHSRPNNVIKIDGTASVPDTLIRKMLVIVGEKKKGQELSVKSLHSSCTSAPLHFVSIYFFLFFRLLQGPRWSSSAHFQCLFDSDQCSFHPCWAETQRGFGKQNFLFIS